MRQKWMEMWVGRIERAFYKPNRKLKAVVCLEYTGKGLWACVVLLWSLFPPHNKPNSNQHTPEQRKALFPLRRSRYFVGNSHQFEE
jgi:hypothetical protein